MPLRNARRIALPLLSPVIFFNLVMGLIHAVQAFTQVYIVSEGGLTPYRIKFRSPGFSNLSALDHIARGSKIGDMVAMMGTLDLVIPDIDR